MRERLPARARALASELKVLRERAGLTTRQAAARLGTSVATLNRTELGKRTASVAEVSALLAIYGVVGPERKRIMALVDDVAPVGWFNVGRRLNLLPSLIDFESRATAISTFAPSLVPGLLQTADYARSIIRLGGFDSAELERRVALRLERQQVLFKAPRPAYLAILDEAVLRRPFGGSAAMASQLRWLADLAKQPNIAIRVIPFRHGPYEVGATSRSWSSRPHPRLSTWRTRAHRGFSTSPGIQVRSRAKSLIW